MWIKRSDYDALAGRVDSLNSAVMSLEMRQKVYIPEYGDYESPPSLSLTDAIRAIAEHLGLTLERTRASTKLVKKGSE